MKIRTECRGRTSRIGLEALERRALLTTVNQVLVEEDYRVFLGRAADAGGLASWAANLDGGTPGVGVSLQIASSQEAHAAEIATTDANFLHREPTQAEEGFLLNFLQGGGTTDQLKIYTLATPEFFSEDGSTDQGFVTALYEDVLGRAPDAGISGWVNALNGGASRTTVAADFILSPEAASDEVTADYEAILGRGPDPQGLSHWVADRDNDGSDAAVITQQQLAADLINSPENLSRIAAAIAATPSADPEAIAAELLRASQLPIQLNSTDFNLSPSSINLGTIDLSGIVVEPVSSSFTVTDNDSSRSLAFSPEVVAGDGSYHIPASAFSFTDANGNALSGPIVLAPGQTVTIRFSVNPSAIPASLVANQIDTATIGLVDQYGEPISPRKSGDNGTVQTSVQLTGVNS